MDDGRRGTGREHVDHADRFRGRASMPRPISALDARAQRPASPQDRVKREMFSGHGVRVGPERRCHTSTQVRERRDREGRDGPCAGHATTRLPLRVSGGQKAGTEPCDRGRGAPDQPRLGRQRAARGRGCRSSRCMRPSRAPVPPRRGRCTQRARTRKSPHHTRVRSHA
jgi:hypothetical protein